MADNLLVTTAWLMEHLSDDDLRIVDIRGHVLPANEPPPHYYAHRSEYEESHIPHAVFVDWASDIVEPNSPSYDVANPQRYQNLMEALGIGDEHFVIAYDDANGMFAARFWWTMKYYGHEQVAILDGGWQKWIAENQPVSSDKPDISPTTFTPKPQAQWNSTASEIISNKPILLDVRSRTEFAGEASRAKRKGHIPNAINIPRSKLVATDGTLRPVDELQQIFTDAGLSLDAADVVVYCNSGVSASYGLIALQKAGLSGGRVYDGSWKDWGNDDTKLVE
ncbi:MAG: sulfurtransferase [Anaerolineae bacterium]|nr:sulfurtransferase [Anaerolineae bacterium]